jgi:hypothetical protein
MKAVFAGILAAVILAIAAAQLLDNQVQQDAAQHFRTEGVRL